MNNNNRVRIQDIKICWLTIESVPSKSIAPINKGLTSIDWQDIVITAEDEDGVLYEVTRIPVQYDGMLSESYGSLEKKP